MNGSKATAKEKMYEFHVLENNHHINVSYFKLFSVMLPVPEFKLNFPKVYRRSLSFLANLLANVTLYTLKTSENYPANIYLFKVNNRNTRKRCEICSKFTLKTPVFIANLEHISHLSLVFLLLTLNS